jgi:hypothetical protein
LSYLKKECDERGAAIIYATHIFDGLDDWPSHIVSLFLIFEVLLVGNFFFRKFCKLMVALDVRCILPTGSWS